MKMNEKNTYLGESIPKLGFGLMRLPQKDDKNDMEQICQMVDRFLESGFTYFDTAWGYGGGSSEMAVKEALVKRHARESFLLATKLPAWAGAKTKEEAEQMLATSLERTGAGYFDFYLLHNLGDERTHCFDEFGIWDFVQQKKKEGILRHVGFSFHDKADELEKILTAHPEMEFVQLQINYADWDDAVVQSRKCYEIARKHHKPVIIMEPVKGGTLADPPQSVKELLTHANPTATPSSWAIRFAASLEGIVTVLSGMSTIEQVEDNLSTMKAFRPLNEEEKEVIVRAQKALYAVNTIPCTSCHYCTDGCPANVSIPGIFQAFNSYQIYHDLQSAKGSYQWNTSGRGLSGADACLECGQCEAACPQHIHIMEELKKAKELFS